MPITASFNGVELPDPHVQPTMDLVPAGRALGCGKDASYEMARTGTFPVPLLRVGRRWRVPTAHVRAALGLTNDS